MKEVKQDFFLILSRLWFTGKAKWCILLDLVAYSRGTAASFSWTLEHPDA